MAINDEVCGKRLAYQLRIHNFTQAKFADKVGIKRTNVSRIVVGKGTTVLKQYQSIADGLGISSGYLVGEHDDPNGPKMTGTRLCRTCKREIRGNRFECDECARKRLNEQKELQKHNVKPDKGLVGTMKEASRIAREARAKDLSYGKYVALYGDGRL